MANSELAKGSAIFLAVALVGFLSTNTVDQHFTALAGQKAACVRANGSWKNWSWSNVPMLSPKCSEKPA
jgi:hypothetical protein